MKNVIVFALGGARYAIELRWVREVTVLGHLTPVPQCPDVIAGVVNMGGAIVPVLQLPGMAERLPRHGDSAVVVEVEGARAAIRVESVQSVSSLEDAEDGLGLAGPGGGNSIPLLDPPALIRDAITSSQAIATGAS
jgi:purine-binding chemotaxis protein CheW